MSLIVEDGTGVTGAVAYSTLLEFKAYIPRGGLSIPATATDAQLEAAMVRGTAYVDGRFRWPGLRESETQGLAWPRYEAYDDDDFELSGVPDKVKNACLEAALIEANEPGALSEALEHGGRITSEKVGSLSTTYAGGASPATVYPIIKQCLAGIIQGGGGVRLSR